MTYSCNVFVGLGMLMLCKFEYFISFYYKEELKGAMVKPNIEDWMLNYFLADVIKENC